MAIDTITGIQYAIVQVSNCISIGYLIQLLQATNATNSVNYCRRRQSHPLSRFVRLTRKHIQRSLVVPTTTALLQCCDGPPPLPSMPVISHVRHHGMLHHVLWHPSRPWFACGKFDDCPIGTIVVQPTPNLGKECLLRAKLHLGPLVIVRRPRHLQLLQHLLGNLATPCHMIMQHIQRLGSIAQRLNARGEESSRAVSTKAMSAR